MTSKQIQPDLREPVRQKQSGSHLQGTPPGRTFPSGTCGPAPTFRWPGYPQCPGREGWSRSEGGVSGAGGGDVCLDLSPLLVLEPSDSASTPDCSQTRLRRQRQPVNHTARGAFRYRGLPENSRRGSTLQPARVKQLHSNDEGDDDSSIPAGVEMRTPKLYIYQTEQAERGPLPESHTHFGSFHSPVQSVFQTSVPCLDHHHASSLQV